MLAEDLHEPVIKYLSGFLVSVNLKRVGYMDAYAVVVVLPDSSRICISFFFPYKLSGSLSHEENSVVAMKIDKIVASVFFHVELILALKRLKCSNTSNKMQNIRHS